MAGMTTICAAAAASFAPFASGVATPVTGVAFAVTSGQESKVAYASLCALASGFPRRSRGRFGSASGSSASDAFAVSGGAGVFAASAAVEVLALSGELGALAGGGAVEAAGGLAGFCWSRLASLFASASLSLLAESLFGPLSESVFSARRCSTGGASLSSSAILGSEYFFFFSGIFVPAGNHVPSAIQAWFSCPGCVIVNTPCDTPARNPS